MGRKFAGHPLYGKRVKRTQTSNLIAYWPLDENDGTMAYDHSAEVNAGTYSGVTMAATNDPFGRKAPLFDGSASYLDIYSAGFNTDWSEAAGTVSAWAKVVVPSVWSDSTARRIVIFRTDANNYISILKATTTNEIDFFHVAGGTSDSVTDTSLGGTSDWFHVALTWSVADDAIFAYINGVQVGTATGLGTWAGALTSTTTVIGSSSTTAAAVWSGYIAHVAVWKVALTAGEVEYLSRLRS